MTETPTVPAWIDIDAIYPPELVAEAKGLAEELLEHVPTALSLAGRCAAFSARAAEGDYLVTSSIADDAFIPLRTATGVHDVDLLAGVLVAAWDRIAGGVPGVEHVGDVVERYGIDWPSGLGDLGPERDVGRRGNGSATDGVEQ